MNMVPTKTIRKNINNMTNTIMDQKTQLGHLFIDITVALSNARSANNIHQFRQNLAVLSSDAVSIAKDIAKQRNALANLHAMNDDCLEMSEEDYASTFNDFKNMVVQRDVQLQQLQNKYNDAKNTMDTQ
jgi:hypothetical protein